MLRDSAERRRQMAAIVSHDLRSPLSAIRAAAHVVAHSIARMKVPPLNTVTRIESSVARMVRMLDDLHDFMIMESGGIFSVTRVRASVRTLCEEAVEEARLTHAGREIEFAGKDIAVEVDPWRFRQMLTNLVNNALTYGATDRPVGVSLRRVTGGCVVTVNNEGEPIPEEMIPTLFQPFARGPGTGSAQQRGHLGLGLFIVQQIVRAHEGSIDVKSTPHGTHFSVYLPIP